MDRNLGLDYRSKEEKNSMTFNEIYKYEILMNRRSIEQSTTGGYSNKYSTPAWKEVKAARDLAEWGVRLYMGMTDDHTTIGARLENKTPKEIRTLWRTSDSGRIKVLDL